MKAQPCGGQLDHESVPHAPGRPVDALMWGPAGIALGYLGARLRVRPADLQAIYAPSADLRTPLMPALTAESLRRLGSDSERRRLLCILALAGRQLAPPQEDDTPLDVVRSVWRSCRVHADAHEAHDLAHLPVVLRHTAFGKNVRLRRDGAAIQICRDAVGKVVAMLGHPRARPGPGPDSQAR